MNNVGFKIKQKYKQKGLAYPVMFFTESMTNWKPMIKEGCYGTYCKIEPALFRLREIYFDFNAHDLFNQFVLRRARQR